MMLKTIRATLLASALTLGATAPAQADPITASIATFLGGSALATAAAQVVVGVGLSVVGGLIGNLFSGDQPETRQPGTSVQVTYGEGNPLEFPLGPTATAGTLFYAGSWGQHGDIPNACYVEARIVSDMPVSEFVGFWAEDQRLTLGSEHPERGWPVLDYRTNRGKDHVWIKALDGTQTSADPYLRDKFGSHPQYPYTSNMVGYGRAIVIVSTLQPQEDDREILNGRPDILTELGSIRLYNIAKDSSEGGSGSHRWDDPATWEPSANRAVQEYNVLRGIHYGDEWVYGGQNWDAFRLPASSWIAAINACDLSVPLRGGAGSEPQFAGGGMVSCDTESATAVEELNKSSNATIAEVGGIYKIRVGAPGVPVMGFGDDDIIVTRERGYRPFDGLEDTANTINSTYQEPAERWGDKEAPAIRDTSMIEEDGRVLPIDVSYPWVQSNPTVQRLNQAKLKNGRRWRTHQHYLPPVAWLLEPLDVLSWTSEPNGYQAKGFDIEGLERGMDMIQGVTIREVDPADYDWAPETDERAYAIVPVVKLPVPVMGSDTIIFEPTVFFDADGNARRPGVQMLSPTGLADTIGIDVEIRHKGTGGEWFNDRVAYRAPSQVVPVALLPDQLYEARGRFVPESRTRATTWGPWQDVLTEKALLGADDIFDGIIGFDKLGDDLRAWQEFVGPGLREAVDEARRVADLVRGVQAALDGEIKRKARRIESRADSGFAEAERQLLTLAGPDGVLARQIDTTRVELEGAITEAEQSLTSLIEINETGITALSQDLISLETQVEEDIASATQSLTTLIEVNESGITALSQDLTELEAQVNDDISSAISLLSAEVSDVEGITQANANAITSLSTEVDGIEASVNIRAQAQSGPGGGWSRYAIELVAEGSKAFFFLDANGSQTRAVYQFDQFIIADRYGSPVAIFANDGTVQTARIRNLETDSFRAKSIDADEIVIDGTILTDLIAQNQVTEVYTTQTDSSFGVGGSWTTVRSVTLPAKANWKNVLNFSFKLETDNAYSRYSIQILENGSRIYRTEVTQSKEEDGATARKFVTVPFAAIANASGSMTYELQISAQRGSGTVSNRFAAGQVSKV